MFKIFSFTLQGVQIFAVGVTNEIDVDQLQDITGYLQRVYTVQTFEELTVELSARITLEAVRETTMSYTIIKTNSTISVMTGNHTGSSRLFVH